MGLSRSIIANIFRSATLSPVGIFMTAASASAQSTSIIDFIPDQRVASSGTMLIIFVGAFAFAMWSATWLIRERRQLEENNRASALELADLKARHERAQALLDVPDQRVVIWETLDGAPVCRGNLPPNTGAPAAPEQFIGFGTWMTPQSAQSFEHAVSRLRQRAEAFDLTVETKSGLVIEVQGRTSGSHAFVRFIGLSGDRAALASLETQHTRLMQTTDTMKSLLESIPFPVWLRDASDQLTWANGAYINAVDAESLDKACQDNSHLLDAGDRKKIITKHQEGRQDTAVSNFNGRLPTTVSGDRRMMDVSEVAYEGGSAGLAVDMSEVEDVQANLRRTLESHAQTMNQLATAVAIFDDKRHLTFHNQAFENLWQLEGGLLEGEPDNGQLFDALRDAKKIAEQPDFTKWRNELLSVYEATQPEEHWWHLPDGRTLRVVATPQKQGGVTWVFENITEQLAMESRYIAMTQVQGETLDNLSEAIAVFTPDGRLKLSNPSFQKLWELEDEQVAAETPIAQLTAHCRSFMEDASLWDDFSTNITGVLDARTTQSGRMQLVAGKVLDYALVPLPNGQTLLSFADITDSVNLEHTLKERNEALEAAQHLKNAFIEHVSYEFRTPLTNIKGFAEMLDQRALGPLNEKQAEYIGHIASSSNVLHALVDNLLDLATVDAGIMELDLQQIKIKETMRAAARSVADMLQEKRITLNIKQGHTSQNTNHFVADASRVQQILFNLLSNAISFSPENSNVMMESEVENNAVILRITDSGPGIPEELRGTLFERFNSQSHGTGRRGAGLGLSIARSLIKLHGGTLELDDTITQGACFVCTFPLMPEADTTPAREAAQ